MIARKLSCLCSVLVALSLTLPSALAAPAQEAYLKSPNVGEGDRFGRSVAVWGDTAVIGAHVDLLVLHGANGEGGSGADGSGAAYVFVRSGTNWVLQAILKASNADPFDYFGSSVAIWGDTIVVGAVGESSNATGVNGNQNNNSADGSGAAYVFVRNGTNWTQQAYLKASNTRTVTPSALPSPSRTTR
jgi:hypothetical protein